MLRPRTVPQFVIVGLIALFAILLVRPPLKSTPASAPPPLDRKRFIATWEETLRATVNDPESAKFRAESVSLRGAHPIVCGEVNIKNEHGGYDGFRHFLAGPDLMGIDGLRDGGEVAKRWDELCVVPGAPDGKASR